MIYTGLVQIETSFMKIQEQHWSLDINKVTVHKVFIGQVKWKYSHNLAIFGSVSNEKRCNEEFNSQRKDSVSDRILYRYLRHM